MQGGTHGFVSNRQPLPFDFCLKGTIRGMPYLGLVTYCLIAIQTAFHDMFHAPLSGSLQLWETNTKSIPYTSTAQRADS